MARKRIIVLGSTGSIGRNVLDVVAHHADEFEVVGLAARRNVETLAEQLNASPGARFAVSEDDAHARLIAGHPELTKRSAGCGNGSMRDLISSSEPDLVVNALVGFAGLEPTLEALGRGVDVALANKEAVVTGGQLLRHQSQRSGATIIPIDSEHVAISQCLRGSAIDEVRTIFVTASGGALREHDIETLADVTREDVLAHPTWDMGNKITVDCATLVNKGLEVIEAHWLFNLPYERIKVIIHPQSIVHSLVEFRDNSIIAQMGVPDMRLPILYALGYPDRVSTKMARSNVFDFPGLTFQEVDPERYPCFPLVMEAGRRGGALPTVLNAANEVAVGAFLAGKIGFTKIHEIIAAALDAIGQSTINGLDDLLETDRRTRAYTKEEFGV
jgi:1-deoxy-D-xylulose-5-phosphate reductoisomerase